MLRLYRFCDVCERGAERNPCVITLTSSGERLQPLTFKVERGADLSRKTDKNPPTFPVPNTFPETFNNSKCRSAPKKGTICFISRRQSPNFSCFKLPPFFCAIDFNNRLRDSVPLWPNSLWLISKKERASISGLDSNPRLIKNATAFGVKEQLEKFTCSSPLVNKRIPPANQITELILFNDDPDKSKCFKGIDGFAFIARPSSSISEWRDTKRRVVIRVENLNA
mmetsp:Transcript_7149/g.9709  ORF Transcript_7149/g.9709 Transcript_7149/m.9709 type:complete len:224 (+) Transcript_7149:790-1461(+)